MLDEPKHHCGVAGMRTGEKSRINASSAVEALIHEQWNRGGAGWGLRSLINHAITRAGGDDRSSVASVKRRLGKRDRRVDGAIGHARYVTSGPKEMSQAESETYQQPFDFEAAGKKWTFCFNGNIANYPTLRTELGIVHPKITGFYLQQDGSEPVSLTFEYSDVSTGKPDVDTQAISILLEKAINTYATAIEENKQKGMKLVFDELEQKLDGCFNIVLMNEDSEMYAYRDSHGFRPLVYAETTDGSTVVASEDSAIKQVFGKCIKEIKDILPGELLIADAFGAETLRVREMQLESHAEVMKQLISRCFFEWIYFAKGRTTFDGVSVDKIHRTLGRSLAEEERPDHSQPESAGRMHAALKALREFGHRITGQRFREQEYRNAIVIGVPDSGRGAGEEFAQAMGIRYLQAMTRRPGSGRSFLQGTSEERHKVAREKFEYHPKDIKDKDIYLVEDSVVRGTTMEETIGKLKKEYGARSVNLRVTSPAIIGPCFYGIDFPTIQELLLGEDRDEIAREGKLTEKIEKKVAEHLGCDSVKFLSTEGMLEAFERCGMKRDELCTACIHGTPASYPTPAGRRLFELQLPSEQTIESA